MRELAGVDPDRIARYARARRPIREATMKKRWCSTLWPTEALAAQAGMALEDFAAFVRSALFLDQPDPVKAWGGLRAFQERLIGRLRDARELRLEAEGTDLTLSVAGRTWVNSDGKRNMPSGEVFTGPQERSANGRVRFTVRSAPAGIDVDGVELELRDGEVVSARAAVGDDYLQRALATDDGARCLGEIGIGTNFGIARPTGTILFDEKIGGTVHLALGRSYPGDRRQEPLRAALGPHLRPARRRAADRRRRGRAGGRALQPVDPPERGATPPFVSHLPPFDAQHPGAGGEGRLIRCAASLGALVRSPTGGFSCAGCFGWSPPRRRACWSCRRPHRRRAGTARLPR